MLKTNLYFLKTTSIFFYTTIIMMIVQDLEIVQIFVLLKRTAEVLGFIILSIRWKKKAFIAIGKNISPYLSFYPYCNFLSWMKLKRNCVHPYRKTIYHPSSTSSHPSWFVAPTVFLCCCHHHPSSTSHHPSWFVAPPVFLCCCHHHPLSIIIDVVVYYYYTIIIHYCCPWNRFHFLHNHISGWKEVNDSRGTILITK